MRILVTGSAGFIGNAVALRLLERGDAVAGLDSVVDDGDVALKEARLARLTPHPAFREARLPLEDAEGVGRLFEDFRPERVVHLAARTGVRRSFEEPAAYVQANLAGFATVLEACRRHATPHLVFASSSSVYGADTATPFSEHQGSNHPVSFYAATKKANEMMAHAYSHRYGLPVTGIRIFTAYGPWGRPDMATYAFTRAMLRGEPIQVFNEGKMVRDFTYVDDVVEGFVRVLERSPLPNPAWDGDAPDPATSSAPYRLYNLGNGTAVPLSEFIAVLERTLGVQAKQQLLPMQGGDLIATCGDGTAFERDFGFRPATSIATGLARFVAWYRDYHGV